MTGDNARSPLHMTSMVIPLFLLASKIIGLPTKNVRLWLGAIFFYPGSWLVQSFISKRLVFSFCWPSADRSLDGKNKRKDCVTTLLTMSSTPRSLPGKLKERFQLLVFLEVWQEKVWPKTAWFLNGHDSCDKSYVQLCEKLWFSNRPHKRRTMT